MENAKQFNLKELLADKNVTIYNSSLTKEDFCVEDALLFSESEIVIKKTNEKVHMYNGRVNENTYFTCLEKNNEIVFIVCKTEEELKIYISTTKRFCSMNIFTSTILFIILRISAISLGIVTLSLKGLRQSYNWITKRIKNE